MAPISSTVGKTRKEAACYILRNATSETNIESNAFSHTGKESRKLLCSYEVVFPHMLSGFVVREPLAEVMLAIKNW